MFHLVLYQPEIPPNTGTLLRLGAATGCTLHLIEPLGFTLSDKGLQRAGMDYRDRVHYHRHIDWQACLAHINHQALAHGRVAPSIYAMTTKGSRCYAEATFNPGDVLLFGPETRGLPEAVLQPFSPEHRLRIPMRDGERSLNLAMSVAVVTFEAIRQQGFVGLVC